VDRQEHWRERYAGIRPGWRPTTTVYARLIDQRVDDRSRILDIGCGHADLLEDVFVRIPLVFGIDTDHDAMRRNTTIRHTTVATGERLPFASGAFDLVLMAWVLEHLERPVTVFREIHRVLGPGGRVVFVTPNAWNYNAWLIRLVPNAFHAFFTERLYGRTPSDTYPTRYRFNSIRRIDSALRRIGYERERVVLNGDPTYIAFNRPLFGLAVWLERLFDLPWLRRARVHIVGVYRKPRDASGERRGGDGND
jgi:SAM-dependent methyltransferase